MTTSLDFKTHKDFRDYIENAGAEICSCILDGIKQALEENVDNPCLMVYNIKDVGLVYEMTVLREEWINSLSKCLTKFTELNYPDQAIDTYMLMKELAANLETESFKEIKDWLDSVQ